MHTASKRVAAVCAIGFVILFFAAQTGGAIAPWGPDLVDASGNQIRTYLVDNMRALGWSAALSALMLALLIGFVVAAYDLFRNDARSQRFAMFMLVGGVVSTVLSMTGLAMLAAPLSDDLPNAPQTLLQTWYSLTAVNDALQTVATFPRALLIGGLALAGLRSGLLGRWMAHTGVVTAGAMTIGGFIWAGLPDGGVLYPFWMASYLLYPLWLAAAGLRLAVGRRRRTLAPTPSTTTA